MSDPIPAPSTRSPACWRDTARAPAPRPPRRGAGPGPRAGLLILALALLLAGAGCSPEAVRARGDGLGADVGNTALPIQMHGNRERNNPAFGVPDRGRVPRDARGVPGWWARR